MHARDRDAVLQPHKFSEHLRTLNDGNVQQIVKHRHTAEGRQRAFAATLRVQSEVDPYLRVVWDDQREKLIVLDTQAPGGPAASYVLIVQNPDGSFRPFDQRTLDTLRELRFGHDRMKATMAKLEAEREIATQKRRAGYGEQVEDVFKFLGQTITSSVSSRERSIARDAIRKAAQ